MTTDSDTADNMATGDKIIKFALRVALLVIPLLVFFLWQEELSISQQIDNGKFGTFGDFFGGVLGSIWSLCGVLLFYTALKEQRRDFKNNEIALSKQVEALNIQTQEFALQREELSQTRKVFVEQSKTLMQQRLESTYFSLLSLYNKVVSDLSNKSSNTCYFKEIKEELTQKGNYIRCPIKKHEKAVEAYLTLFYTRKEDLSHFFKLLYRVIKTIDNSDISDEEKFRYIKIIRSQLSENEMFILYYNSHSHLGRDFYKLILKYNLLKHLPITSKLEFSSFIYKNTRGPSEIESQRKEEEERLAFLHRFNDETIKLLRKFGTSLKQRVFDDEFESYSESYPLPCSDDFYILFSSEDTNMIDIKILYQSNEAPLVSNFELSEFTHYFMAFLYDTYAFSQYKKVEGCIITSTSIDKGLEFKVELNSILSINSDIE
ncbi:TPA: putative phage abortive infection protein [Vibrio vulnificus]